MPPQAGLYAGARKSEPFESLVREYYRKRGAKEMKDIKLSAAVLVFSLFLLSCNQNQPQDIANVVPNPNQTSSTEAAIDGEYWAKDNFDLERVGNLLERSNSPEEFERYLNSNDGINNLDLNGDGYVDYISVDEYRDRGEYERGLSLYSRYGPNDVQELGTVVFYRDDNRSPGARLLLTANEQLYGDNRYYETNWVDKAIGIVSTLFGQRDNYYRSPYYYDNYPDYYQPYQVVETPIYRTRITQIYPQPVFVYTTSPTFITKLKIKSPNNGLHLGQIYAKLAKPTKEQADFMRNNPGRPKAMKFEKGEKGGRPDDQGARKDDKGGRQDDKRMDSPKSDKQPNESRKNDNPSAKPPKADKPNGKGSKPDNGGPNKGKEKGKP